ncbi:hypothetical protein VP01_562g4 [Puccinia sorghi]|uniref:Uncharacterized protein n=1 Tax=Puccinia sorghi TaxID=27349 RepID=A0A0L6UJP7_9BASI|nr:hypothetical protein VP01_562g4 [Puccinia sorghi]
MLAFQFVHKVNGGGRTAGSQEKLEEYQEEALEYEALVMATLLHPEFSRGTTKKEKKELEKYTPKFDNNNIFEFFSAPPNSAKSRELEVYYPDVTCHLVIIDCSWCLAKPAEKDQTSLLIWWKLSQHHLVLLREFLSSEADFCSSGCGSLKPQKMERCVNSHMWLKQGIQVTGKTTLISLKKLLKNNLVFILYLSSFKH